MDRWISSPIESKVIRAFSLASRITFQPGMNSRFTGDLQYLVSKHGEAAIDAIEQEMLNRKFSAEIELECLTCLGRIEDEATHAKRLRLLIGKLTHPHRYVRDGAALGLGSMGDTSAIPALEKAINCEASLDLKAGMVQVLDSLSRKGAAQ